MANISDATGTITITSNNIETVRQIVNTIHKHLGNVQYSTAILTDTEEVVRSDTKTSCSYEFYGYGRWSYACNCENFCNWVEEDPFLTKTEWEICFDFADVEIGVGFLCECSYVLKHSKDQPLSSVSPECARYTEYDINRENLCRLGFDPEWVLIEEEDDFI